MPTQRFVALVLPFLLPSISWAAPDLHPADTHVVIVGTLKWQDKKVTTFSPRNRKDQELYDTLVKLGVPRANMHLLLDEKATLDAIQKSIAALGAQSKPGSTLLFYYCGHGAKLDQGGVAFLNYDYGPKASLNVADIATLISKHFKGERVFLLADCCHSGALNQTAQQLDKAKFKAVCLTSADAGNISTGNWTYTQALLDALNGDPLLDANGDGNITLGELETHLEREMKYREMQRCGTGRHGVSQAFKLAMVASDRKKPVLQGNLALNEFVWATEKGQRRTGRIVGTEGAALTVEFYDYTEKVRLNVPAAKLDKVVFRTYKPGTAVLVEWQGSWWKAKVQKVEGDFHLIRYDGYGAEWDEWALANRVAVGDPAVLRKVQVKRNDEWYSATLLKKQDDKFYVSYDGYAEKFDEFVSKERIRDPK